MVDVYAGESRSVLIKLTEDPKCSADITFTQQVPKPGMTLSPTLVTLNSSNWNTGVSITATAAIDAEGAYHFLARTECSCHPDWNFSETVIPFFVPDGQTISITAYKTPCSATPNRGIAKVPTGIGEPTIARYRAGGGWVDFDKVGACVYNLDNPGTRFDYPEYLAVGVNPNSITEVDIRFPAFGRNITKYSVSGEKEYTEFTIGGSNITCTISDAGGSDTTLVGQGFPAYVSAFLALFRRSYYAREVGSWEYPCVWTAQEGSLVSTYPRSVETTFSASSIRFGTLSAFSFSFSRSIGCAAGTASFSGSVSKQQCDAFATLNVVCAIAINAPPNNLDCNYSPANCDIITSTFNLGQIPGSEKYLKLRISAYFEAGPVGTSNPPSYYCGIQCGPVSYTRGAQHSISMISCNILMGDPV